MDYFINAELFVLRKKISLERKEDIDEGWKRVKRFLDKKYNFNPLDKTFQKRLSLMIKAQEITVNDEIVSINDPIEYEKEGIKYVGVIENIFCPNVEDGDQVKLADLILNVRVWFNNHQVIANNPRKYNDLENLSKENELYYSDLLVYISIIDYHKKWILLNKKEYEELNQMREEPKEQKSTSPKLDLNSSGIYFYKFKYNYRAKEITS